MEGPIAQNWAIGFSVVEKVLSYNHYCATSTAKILLSAHVNHGQLVPSYWLCSDIGAHITYDGHVFWNQMPWESIVIKLKAIDCLIATEVEERRISINLPLGWINHSSTIVIRNVVGDHIDLTELAHLIKGLSRPKSSRQQIGCSSWFATNQVFHDCGVLHSCTSLLKQHSEVVWDMQELSDFILGFSGNLSEFVLSVAQFHDTLPTAFVVKHLFLSFCEDCLW